MAAQQNLLQLFDEQFAATFSAERKDQSVEVPIPSLSSQNFPLNPFRKQTGVCAHCAAEKSIERKEESSRLDSQRSMLGPDVRLYWCHLCNNTGCWDWLQKHKD